MHIGFYQFAPVFGDVAGNHAKIVEALQGAQNALIVLPELATSGYLFLSREEVAELAEPIPGPTTELLGEIARERELYIALGLPERSGDALYNSAVLLGPEGIVAHYRKAHLFYEEKRYFQAGDTPFPLCEIKGVKVGLLICFDHIFPEAARTLALKGAQIIAHPSDLVLPGTGQLTTRVRAMENRIFWVLANRYGKEERGGKHLTYTGESQIIAPDGTILAKAPPEGDALNIVEIDPKEALDKHITVMNDLFEDLRPELYKLK
jgi:predicted amidohydrolase